MHYYDIWQLIGNNIIIFIAHSIYSMCQELYWTFLMYPFKSPTSQTLTPPTATPAISRRKLVLQGIASGKHVHPCTYNLWCQGVNTGETAREWQGIRTGGYGFHPFVLWVISSKMHLIRSCVMHWCDQTPVTHSSGECNTVLLYWQSSLLHVTALISTLCVQAFLT